MATGILTAVIPVPRLTPS